MNVYKILFETADGLLSDHNYVMSHSVVKAIKVFEKHIKGKKHIKGPIEVRTVKRICKVCAHD